MEDCRRTTGCIEGKYLFLFNFFLFLICPKIYKDATLFFSHGTPNLTTVILAMDHINNFLATSAEQQYSPAIRAALAIGKNTINKYYNMTDQSEVYRIAMSMLFRLSTYCDLLNSNLLVLHPRHKLKYFKKHNWEATWIDTARQIVRDEFDRSDAAMDANADEEGMQVDTDEGVSYTIYCFQLRTLITYFRPRRKQETVGMCRGRCNIITV